MFSVPAGLNFDIKVSINSFLAEYVIKKSSLLLASKSILETFHKSANRLLFVLTYMTIQTQILSVLPVLFLESKSSATAFYFKKIQIYQDIYLYCLHHNADCSKCQKVLVKLINLEDQTHISDINPPSYFQRRSQSICFQLNNTF